MKVLLFRWLLNTFAETMLLSSFVNVKGDNRTAKGTFTQFTENQVIVIYIF